RSFASHPKNKDALPLLRHAILNSVRAHQANAVLCPLGRTNEPFQVGTESWVVYAGDIFEQKSISGGLDHESPELIDQRAPLIGTSWGNPRPFSFLASPPCSTKGRVSASRHLPEELGPYGNLG